MAKYFIYEGNLENLQKKAAKIEKKCNKYGCYFKFELTGNEEVRKEKDDAGNNYYLRFVEVEAEGNAAINGWVLVGTIEHIEDGQRNVIRLINNDFENKIPEEYYTMRPKCDHCGTNRYRKYTYLLYNEEGDYYRQVGSSCLEDYTGLSLEYAAAMEQFLHKADEEGEDWEKTFRKYEQLIPLSDILQYSIEFVRNFGYISRMRAEDSDTYPTVERVCEAMNLGSRYTMAWRFLRQGREELEYKQKFNPESEETREEAKDIINWVRGPLHDEVTTSNYLLNIMSVAASDYVKESHIGLAVSIVAAYHRHLDDLKKLEEYEKKEAKGSYVGNVGDRITVDIVKAEQGPHVENMYGVSVCFKFYDKDNNVYVWWTSSYVEDVETVKKLTGTIKKHSEFRKVKQNEMTRCRLSR